MTAPLPSRRSVSPARRRASTRSLRRAAASRAQARIAGRHRGHGPRSFLAVLTSIFFVLCLALVLAAGLLGVATVATVSALQNGLPDPAQLDQLAFAQPTVIYDRAGTTELARFQLQARRVIGFDEVPKLVLDATIGAEDHTFWQNEGFDAPAIVAAVFQNLASGSDTRGASTITQQLVRARLLPADVVAPSANQFVRKAKEILQAQRLTQAFPGEAGKEKIITAYLNDIYYGHDAYGIAAAASTYFGVTDLSKLTPAQAALLAGLPKSPTTLDPYRFAVKDSSGHLVVPQDAPPVVRRNYVLQNLGFGRWTHLSPAELQSALTEPVVLSGVPPIVFKAPQFVWQVHDQLAAIVGADNVATGGYRVITSLDYRAQQLAEKWVTAAAVIPNLPTAAGDRMIAKLKLSASDAAWVRALRGRDVHNGALVAIDYRTGDVLAYVGSAGYYLTNLASPQFDPQFDVAGVGFRQPGSAFKAIVYGTAFEQHVLTPGSLLLDITTPFGKDQTTGKEWIPHDADLLDRGPVRVRQALQYSLNIPAIRALARVGNVAVAKQAAAFGIRFQGGSAAMLQAGLAGALGTVEIHPLDLTAAFGAYGNGGVLAQPRTILEVDGPDGRVIYRAGQPKTKQAISPQTAFLMSDILKGNTDPSVNLAWGPLFHIDNGPNGERRVAALKTGTTNDTRDLSAYGYLAPPTDPSAPGLAVGVWMGNSDHSQPSGNPPVFSLDAPAPLWRSFIRDYTKGRPLADFTPPGGVVKATIDAFSGGQPGPWTRQTVGEWFIKGTEPGSSGAVDKPGLLYSSSCGFWMVDPVKAEPGPQTWVSAVQDWMDRARQGPGVEGQYKTSTAYFFGQSSWGGPIGGPCQLFIPAPTPPPTAGPSPQPSPSPQPPDASPTASPAGFVPPGQRKHSPPPTPSPTPATGFAFPLLLLPFQVRRRNPPPRAG